MIEAFHTIHTHSRSTSYMYKVFPQHLELWLVVIRIRMPPQPQDISLCDLRVDLLGVGSGYLLVLTIEASHPLHTHSRSSLYIYNVC
jgi:hypothetical protein